MESGILDKSFICVIQPVIKALFGNADMTADSDAVEYTLFYQIICCGTTDTQNVLNLIDRMACDGCYHARTMAVRELSSLLCHDRMPSDVFQPDIFLIKRKLIYTAKMGWPVM